VSRKGTLGTISPPIAQIGSYGTPSLGVAACAVMSVAVCFNLPSRRTPMTGSLLRA